jgi:hypothetical protein
LLDVAKNSFAEGKKILQKLIETDDSLRNTKHLPKEQLEKI